MVRLKRDKEPVRPRSCDNLRVWTRLPIEESAVRWNDAFRAAGYPPDQAARYIAKLTSKIAEGLALTGANTAE